MKCVSKSRGSAILSESFIVSTKRVWELSNFKIGDLVQISPGYKSSSYEGNGIGIVISVRAGNDCEVLWLRAPWKAKIGSYSDWVLEELSGERK